MKYCHFHDIMHKKILSPNSITFWRFFFLTTSVSILYGKASLSAALYYAD